MSKHSASGSVWKAQRLRVLERDGWACALCGYQGAAGDPDMTVDHIEPISLDPSRKYSDDMLMALCRSCNATKGARQLVRLDYVNRRWLKELPR